MTGLQRSNKGLNVASHMTRDLALDNLWKSYLCADLSKIKTHCRSLGRLQVNL